MGTFDLKPVVRSTGNNLDLQLASKREWGERCLRIACWCGGTPLPALELGAEPFQYRSVLTVSTNQSQHFIHSCPHSLVHQTLYE